MRRICEATAQRLGCIGVFAGVMLTAMMMAPIAGAQTQGGEQKAVEVKTAQQKAIEYEQMPQIYQMFHLVNATRQMDLNDIQTDLRNILTRARIYGVASQNAISIRGSAEDLAMAQRMITELDQPRKLYRLTYTITETDGGKKMRSERFSLAVVEGERATLKQGVRAPIVTGSFDTESSKSNTQVQYVDLGLNIDVWLDGERLHSKIEQSSVADEKPLLNGQDPTIRQTVLNAMSNLTTEKSVVLGALDIPGSTRHEDVEVAAELVGR